MQVVVVDELLILRTRSGTEWKESRRMARCVISPNQRSTWLSQDE